MSKFVKITTLDPSGNYLRSWIPIEKIEELSQLSGSQDGDNRGNCLLTNGTTVDLVAFNETLDSLN